MLSGVVVAIFGCTKGATFSAIATAAVILPALSIKCMPNSMI